MTARPALIVVDLQVGTLANARAVNAEDWLARAVALVDSFRDRGLPVVVATATGTPNGRTAYAEGAREWPAEVSALVPELVALPSDVRVARRTLSVFSGTGLADRLRADGVTDVVVVGIAASYGVESTARDAYDLGFHVAVVSDAIADLQASSLEHAMSTVFPVIGRVLTSIEVVAELG